MTTDRKVALVTGANRGLGKEIARRLAGMGMVVLATARDADRGRRAVAEIDCAGDVRFVRLDVTATDDIRSAADLVESEFGRLDLLVNNAGITGIPPGGRTSLEELTAEDLHRVLETNFVGVFAVTQAFLPLLCRSAGRVVNLTSTLATFSRNVKEDPHRADLIPYCTSKAAVNLLSVMYARLLAAAGVTIHAVSPGYVATDMNGNAGTKSVQEGAEIVVHVATADPSELAGCAFLTESGTLPW